MIQSELKVNEDNLEKLGNWSTHIKTSVDDLLSQFSYLPSGRATIFIIETLNPLLADIEHTLSVSAIADDKIVVKVTLRDIGNIVRVFDLPKEI